MGEKIRMKYHLLVDDKSILSYYAEAKGNRLQFGFIIPDHDIHLTILFNEDKSTIGPHITDSKPRKGFRKHVWDQHTDIAVVVDEATRRLNSWIKSYHHNRRGWRMTPLLKEKFQELVLPKERHEGELDIPFITEVEFPPFDEPEYWERVRLRDMVGQVDAVILEGIEVDRIAFVIDNRKMMAFSEQQLDNLIDYLFDVLGLYDYLEYVSKRVPKKKFLNI
jgi:hypothetical protein